MDGKNALVAIALIEKILKYGVPAIIRTLQSWSISDPTVEDIKKLRIVKLPKDYFDGK